MIWSFVRIMKKKERKLLLVDVDNHLRSYSYIFVIYDWIPPPPLLPVMCVYVLKIKYLRFECVFFHPSKITNDLGIPGLCKNWVILEDLHQRLPFISKALKLFSLIFIIHRFICIGHLKEREKWYNVFLGNRSITVTI